ncbi:hypothetical protein ACJX0J_011508, partial [Zea mays]
LRYLKKNLQNSFKNLQNFFVFPIDVFGFLVDLLFFISQHKRHICLFFFLKLYFDLGKVMVRGKNTVKEEMGASFVGHFAICAMQSRFHGLVLKDLLPLIIWLTTI